jgi:hypothetical protein
VTGHVACFRAALEEGASGTTTVSASSYFAGFEATLNSTRTYTTTGTMAAFMANISGGTSTWPIGIYIEGCDRVLQAGTSGTPLTSSTANEKFVEIRTTSTATSGDNRLMYLRYDLDGANSSGECLRAFTELGSSTVTTARGAHISLEVNSSGYPTGLGVGVDGQILNESGATGGGTLAAVCGEIYNAGSATIGSSVQSFFMAKANGAAQGDIDDLDDNAYLLNLVGFTPDDAGAHMFTTADAAAATHALKIRIGGTDYWLMVSDSVTAD